MDALVYLRKKEGAGGSYYRRASPGDAALGHAIRRLCRGRLAIPRAAEEDDRGGRGVCAAFGLAVSEAKTENMCLRTKGMSESIATFSGVETAGQVQPNERVRLPRGGRQPQCRPVHRGQSVRTQRMVQLSKVYSRIVRPTERPARAQNPDAKSRGARDNAARLRHVEPARVPLRHAAPSPPQLPDSLHRLAKE